MAENGPDRVAAVDDLRAGSPAVLLVAVSVLGLALQMMFIRWLATEIRIFSYLQNTILVVCFLGLGLGCLTSRQPIVLRDVLARLAILSACLALPPTRFALAAITALLSGVDDNMFWCKLSAAGGPVATALLTLLGLMLCFMVMTLMVDACLPLGRAVGRLLSDHPRPIAAYSLNIAGSLAGTWVVAALSALWCPPWVWLLAIVAGLLALIDPRRPGYGRAVVLAVACVALGFVSGREPGAVEVAWSPYQKLVLHDATWRPSLVPTYATHTIAVNDVGFMWFGDQRLASAPARVPTSDGDVDGLGQYDLPYRLVPKHRRVLIVGAGAGNDVAAALRNGAEEVVAVEIDPVVVAMSRRWNNERPYHDPRVTLVLDDARAYFGACRSTFDLVVFGLLDSHTTTGFTHARLDSYVYTAESIRHAHRLLAPGGCVVLTFAAVKQFLSDRIGHLLLDEFGGPPLAMDLPATRDILGGYLFVAGDLAAVRAGLAARPALSALVETWQRDQRYKLDYTTPVTTDDWPFFYLPGRSIPVLYWLMAGVMLLLYTRCRTRYGFVSGRTPWSGDRTLLHFFFLGAAFMLLEVEAISAAALALGCTWLVTSVVVSGVLVMALAANLVVSRFPDLPMRLVFGGLLATTLTLYFTDLGAFVVLPYVQKAVLVGALTTLPMFFSGYAFTRAFSTVAARDEVLGANLLGALAGALVQPLSFVTGVRSLLLVVAAFYLAAMLTRPRD